MIKRIFIDGYKCYRKFEMLFDGKPFSFLAGRNGAGKTTLFEVLALVRDIACRGRPLVDEMTGRFLVMGDTSASTAFAEEAANGSEQKSE